MTVPIPTVTRTIEKKACAGNVAQVITVPAGVSWSIKALAIKLVTDATVANRQVTVKFVDAEDDHLFNARLGVAHAASLTRYYTYGPGLPDGVAFIDTDKLMGVLPTGFRLVSGSDINISITLGVAGDAFEYRVVVEETDNGV